MIDDDGTYYPDDDEDITEWSRFQGMEDEDEDISNLPVIQEPIRAADPDNKLDQLLKSILEFNIKTYRIVAAEMADKPIFPAWKALMQSGEEQNTILYKLFFLEKDCQKVIPAGAGLPLSDWDKFMISIGADEKVQIEKEKE